MLVNFNFAKLVSMGIYQCIERLILMMESICLGIANVLLSNQFHTFMYGAGLFAINPILYSAVVGFIYGYVIFTCKTTCLLVNFNFAKLVSMGIYQRIERLILMMKSICLGIANVLLSNQFHTFMYGVGLFANNPILYSAVVGFIYGYVIFTCSEYEYANQFDFKKSVAT